MRREAIKLLAHVGLDRDQDRFLMQPVRIEALGLRQERRDLLGEAYPDRLRAPAGRELGALRQRGNFAKPRRQDPSERHAFAAAHLPERGDDAGEALDRRRLGGATLLLTFLGLADLHYAFEREQAVERGRRGFDARRKRLRRRQDCLEHCCIDAHDRQRAAPLHGQVRLNRPARQAFRSAGTYRRLDRVPTGRQAQPQIEPLAVDRFDLPGPGIGAACAMAASKSGHARQRHGTPVSAAKSKKSRRP